MSISYIAIQGSYKSFEIALFEDEECVDSITGAGLQASAYFLLHVEKILKRQKKKFSALSFLAVEQGPGAFASLRIIIATVNGLAFSKKIKLVGVDGLDAVTHETFESAPFSNGMLVSLLNAYNNEVYYAIYDVAEKKLNLSCPKGYKKIDLLLDDLEKTNKKILFTGNGFSFHKDLILEKFGNRVIKTDSVLQTKSVLQTASAKQIGKMGFEQWKRNENVSYELSPLYLKIQTYAVRKPPTHIQF